MNLMFKTDLWQNMALIANWIEVISFMLYIYIKYPCNNCSFFCAYLYLLFLLFIIFSFIIYIVIVLVKNIYNNLPAFLTKIAQLEVLQQRGRLSECTIVYLPQVNCNYKYMHIKYTEKTSYYIIYCVFN